MASRSVLRPPSSGLWTSSLDRKTREMKLLYLIAYLAIEITAFVLLIKFAGFGWALLIALATIIFGFVMLRSQGRKVFSDLRRATRNEVDPKGPLADSALLAVATILLFVPGLVTTVIGTAMLFGPVRRGLRPVVVAVGAKRVIGVMNSAGGYASGVYGRGRVIDGSVVDEQRTRPHHDHAGPSSSVVNEGAVNEGALDRGVVDGDIVYGTGDPRHLPPGAR